MFDSVLQFLGRLHPMILHLPIGLLAGLVGLEVVARLGRRPPDVRTRTLLAAMLAAGAVVSAGSGWRLAEESGYGGDTLELHRWLGVSTAALSVAVAACAAVPQWRRGYVVVLALAAATVAPAGHFGATITHGADFLFEPFRAKSPMPRPRGPSDAAPPAVAATSRFETGVGPIFAARCAACHGPDKQKGLLRLDTIEGILAGGESGPAIAPGDAASSELVYRLKLPPDKKGRMPPRDSPQPSTEEIAAIEAWIQSGASFTATDELRDPREDE